MTADERRLGFDRVADLYHEARPGYPAAAIERIARHAGLDGHSRILEIGCGTGQATRPFAERGFRVLALELGPALAQRARRELADFPRVEVLTTSFEAWTPAEQPFDLALSAQAFHWIEPDLGVATLGRVVRPGGSVALMWHIDASQHTEFYRRSQPVYHRYFPASPDTWTGGWTARVARYRTALERCPPFGEIEEHHFPWTETYPRERYLKLLRTYSDTQALAPETRERFVTDIAKVIDEVGPVERSFVTLLLLARRHD